MVFNADEKYMLEKFYFRGSISSIGERKSHQWFINMLPVCEVIFQTQRGSGFCWWVPCIQKRFPMVCNPNLRILTSQHLYIQPYSILHLFSFVCTELEWPTGQTRVWVLPWSFMYIIMMVNKTVSSYVPLCQWCWIVAGHECTFSSKFVVLWLCFVGGCSICGIWPYCPTLFYIFYCSFPLFLVYLTVWFFFTEFSVSQWASSFH